MTHAVLDAELSPRAHHLPAAGFVVLATALLVALPANLGDRGLVVAVAVLQLGLVAAWVVATGIRGFLGSLAIGVAAAAGADVALLLPDRARLDQLLVVLGLAFLAAVAHQMTRPAPRRYLVASLAGVLLLVACVCSLAVLLMVGRTEGGNRVAATYALVVGAALVVGHLVDLVLPRPLIADGVPRGLLGLGAGVLAAVAVALLRRNGGDLIAAMTAVTSGAALGAVAVLMGLGASYVVAERAQHGWALAVVQAVLPLAAVAPVAYALALYTGS
ncbi:hypothetical protein SAMN05661080_04617 [Modestobacter sp. DSM 44400]|uniref:hypothetical protein n=1 Tax=Modestobacter sp. DSM 44400 TaxID=1550230 RepID=UPI00089BB3B7|nr:hypothetical protein [Modestobacter sp. DSM 44400]SDY79067.1 hypothetical protein SAMN05661080_04617 [Modestobacter sp. DSM 44400]